MADQPGSIDVQLREPTYGTVLLSLLAVATGLVGGGAVSSVVTKRIYGESALDALSSGNRRRQFVALVVVLTVGSVSLSLTTKAVSMVVYDA